MLNRQLSRKRLSGIVAGIGLLIGVTSNPVAAQMPPEMPAHLPETTPQFHAIEQPLWLKRNRHSCRFGTHWIRNVVVSFQPANRFKSKSQARNAGKFCDP